MLLDKRQFAYPSNILGQNSDTISKKELSPLSGKVYEILIRGGAVHVDELLLEIGLSHVPTEGELINAYEEVLTLGGFVLKQTYPYYPGKARPRPTIGLLPSPSNQLDVSVKNLTREGTAKLLLAKAREGGLLAE